MSAQLLPCPFCGGHAQARGDDLAGHWIDCAGCDCMLGYIAMHERHCGLFKSSEDAANDWNRRQLVEIESPKFHADTTILFRCSVCACLVTVMSGEMTATAHYSEKTGLCAGSGAVARQEIINA